METLIQVQVYHKGKHVGTERLTEKGWEWRMFELDSDNGERWSTGVFMNDPDLKRIVEHKNARRGNEFFYAEIIDIIDKSESMADVKVSINRMHTEKQNAMVEAEKKSNVMMQYIGRATRPTKQGNKLDK